MRLIDCRNDSVLVDTVLGEGVAYLEAHTGDGEKVYIAHGLGGVEVLDASTLSLRTTIGWEHGVVNGILPFFVYSDTTDKLYWFVADGSVTDPESALVIDTRGDTVVARLGAGVWHRPGCLDHTGRYIFCPDEADSSLFVYDSQIDSVAAVYSGLPGPLCVKPNPERAQVYVGCDEVILVYPDAPLGVEEMPNAEVRTTSPGPTVVRGTLNLQPAICSLQSEIALLSVDGRKVLDLRPGPNDVRSLAPGVYFLRGPMTEDGRPGASVRKVVVTR
ncbi:hypothetical protein FJY68_13370 [candidate division WOR-3 bacterium]|uniref:Uncharacterized protein n=1 Tax=candidate division WOR-3 bacterium TaxID=2052148 RepID=A0A937XK59_UNCW3|nr:hypothetical protein [candidate division WOR-3 bacterium]